MPVLNKVSIKKYYSSNVQKKPLMILVHPAKLLGFKNSTIYHTALLSTGVQRAEQNYGGYIFFSFLFSFLCRKSIDDMDAPCITLWS